jgi:PadR family transcriptional regulator PadR
MAANSKARQWRQSWPEKLFTADKNLTQAASIWRTSLLSARPVCPRNGHRPKVLLRETEEYRNSIFIMTKRVRAKIARGSAELAILTLLNKQQLYGFEIAKRIEEDSGGAIRFNLASLYPMLYTLEKRGWITGRWESNRAGRDRRYYCLTSVGRKQLAPLRQEWKSFFRALNLLAGVSRA